MNNLNTQPSSSNNNKAKTDEQHQSKFFCNFLVHIYYTYIYLQCVQIKIPNFESLTFL